MPPHKTLSERFLHALLFELIAIALCGPAMGWAMDKPVWDTSLLTAAISLAAMLWNMVYNAGYERLEAALGWRRTPAMRGLHAVGFEGGLIVIVVPLAAWWLGISLWQAFLLDISLLLFFLPYTYVYNLVYDKLREARLRRAVQA